MVAMKILVAGMGRSGSTALYNIIRIACERAGKTIRLNKTHGYNAKLHKWADMIFTSKRDMRDVVISDILFESRKCVMANVKKATPDALGRRCKRHLKLHADWQQYSDYEFAYERFVATPAAVIKEVLSVLGIKGDVQKIHNDLCKLLADVTMHKKNIPESRIQFYHVTNADYQIQLSSEQIQGIESVAGDWLLLHGYPLGEDE